MLLDHAATRRNCPNTRRQVRRRGVAAMVAAAVLAAGSWVAAMGIERADAQWVGASGAAAGRAAGHAGPPGNAGPDGSAGADGNMGPDGSGSPVRTDPRRGSSAVGGTSPVPGAATPGAPVRPTGPDAPGADRDAPPALREHLAKIPKFPPAPRPEKVNLPAGPAVPWLSRVPTSQPVAFITVDDGWSKRPEAVALLRAAQVPITMFLTVDAIRNDPGYFKQLQAQGAVVEAHTVTHASLVGKSYSFQRQEICGSAEQLGNIYGRRPVLFRPPFGAKDDTTLRAARDCGMKGALFWTQTVDKGVVRYQQGNKVQPGDILLMHFRPAFEADLLAALHAIHTSGLTPALLEDYVAA